MKDPFSAPMAPEFRRTARPVYIRMSQSLSPAWSRIYGPTYLTRVRGRVFVIHRDEWNEWTITDLRTGGKVCSGEFTLYHSAWKAGKMIDKYVQ